jgi:hypothetical protein
MSRRKVFHSIAWSIGLGWILGGVVLAAAAISVSEDSGRYQVATYPESGASTGRRGGAVSLPAVRQRGVPRAGTQ